MDNFITIENVIFATIIAIIITILISFIRWFIKTSNKFNRSKVVIKESKKNVDIALAKRYDTICEMLKVAKAYAKHETTTFTDVIKLRGGASMKETDETMRNQDRVLDRIFAIAESYPDLKSSEHFLNLQQKINHENEQLAAAKRIVNNNVSIINQDIVSFPKSIVARLKGIREIEFLAEDDLEKKRSLINLDYDI